MNTITGNSLYSYGNTQQANKKNNVMNGNSSYESITGQHNEEDLIVNTRDSDISMQEAYERLSGSGKALSEAGQDEECEDKSAGVSDVNDLASLAGLPRGTKVTEIAVWSLKDVSFYLNEDTGEISCISHYNNQPGRHPLWSRTISPEDREKVYTQLFDRYKDVSAGDFVFRYRAYLPHEEFWDMYLAGKVDLTTLVENDDRLSEKELYNKFLWETGNRGH